MSEPGSSSKKSSSRGGDANGEASSAKKAKTMSTAPPTIEEEEMNIVPHHNTITKSGLAHFADYAFAVAEHVDNSLQATSTNLESEGREIDLLLFVPDARSGGSSSTDHYSYMVVYDNGCGMDKTIMDAYFTYFFGQKERGLDPHTLREKALDRQEQIREQGFFHPHLSFTISKFGVGALEAAFYLGHRVKVITKAKTDPHVRSFHLDSSELDDKAKTSEDRMSVYQGRNKKGQRAEDMLSPEEKACLPLLEWVRSHESVPHFTYIVMRLKSRIRKLITEDQGRSLAMKLARYYYYYLKPESFPPLRAGNRAIEGIVPLGRPNKVRKVRPAGDVSSEPGTDGERPSTPTNRSGVPPVKIGVKYITDYTSTSTEGLRSYDLREMECVEDAFLDNAVGDPFFFSLEVTMSNSLDEKEQNGGYQEVVEKKSQILGVLRYYGYQQYRETKPSLSCESTVVVDDSDTSSDEMANGRNGGWAPSDGRRRGETRDPTFDVRWMSRLLPSIDVLGKWLCHDLWILAGGKCGSIAILPSTDRYRVRQKAILLGEEVLVSPHVVQPSFLYLPWSVRSSWERRIHGTLFFSDWDISISNNKLRILTGEGGTLESLLNNKKKCTLERRLGDQFSDWLRKCHKEHDKEQEFFRWSRVDRAAKKTFFDKVRYGRSSSDVISKGDNVKLFLKGNRPVPSLSRGGSSSVSSLQRQGSSASGAALGKQEVLGTIVEFEVVALLEPEQTYTGDGMVIYTRHPSDVFGDERCCAPLKCLNYELSRTTPEKWETALDEETKKKVDRMVVYPYEEFKQKGEKKTKPLGKSLRLTVGGEDNAATELAVYLYDGQNNNIGKKSKLGVEYKVIQEVKGPERFKTLVHESTTPFVEPLNNKHYHHFKKFEPPRPGTYTLTLKVLQASPAAGNTEKVLVSKTCNIIVSAGEASEFFIEDLPGGRAELRLDKPCPMPKFTLILKDVHGGYTTAPHGITVSLKGNKMVYRPKKGSSTIWQGNYEDAEEGISFSAGDWVADLPDIGEPIIGKEKVGVWEEEVMVNVGLVPAPNDPQGSEPRELPSKKITMVFTPGIVNYLELVDPSADNGPIEVENGEHLPPLVLQTFDFNSNLTAPRAGESWLAEVRNPTGEIPSVQYADGGPIMARRGTAPRHEVNNKGQCTITGLVARVPWKGDRASVKGDFQVVVHAETPHLMPIALRIIASTKPSMVEILRKKKPIGATSESNPLRLKAAEEMKNLSIRLSRQNGQPVEVEKGSRAYTVTASWSAEDLQGRFPDLPDLVADTKSSPSVKKYVVTCTGEGLSTAITASLFVLVGADEPTQWDSDAGLSRPIKSGVEVTKDNLLWLRDKHKNKCTKDRALLESIHPQVTLTPRNALECPIKVLPEHPIRLTLGPDGFYRFPGPFTVIGPAQSVDLKVHLPASDKKPYEERRSSFELQPGPPAMIRLSCPTLLGSPSFLEPRTRESGGSMVNVFGPVQLCSGTDVEGLQIQVLDREGYNRGVAINPKTMVVVTYEAPEGQIIGAPVPLKDSDANGVIDIPTFKYLSPHRRDLVVTVGVINEEGSTRRQGRGSSSSAPTTVSWAQILLTSILKVNLQKANRVNEIKGFTVAVMGNQARSQALPEVVEVTVPSGSTGFPVDEPLPCLAFQFKTENGEDLPLQDMEPSVLTVRAVREGDGSGLPPVDILGFYYRWQVATMVDRSEEGGGRRRLVALMQPKARDTNDSNALVMAPGEIKVNVLFEDQRESIRKLSSGSIGWTVEAKNCLRLIFTPGRPVAIGPHSDWRDKVPPHMTVSNRADNADTRRLLQNMVLVPLDRYNNPTFTTSPLRMSIEPDSSSNTIVLPASAAVYPQLDGARNGIMELPPTAGRSPSLAIRTTEWRLRDVKLQEKAGTHDCIMVFVCRAAGIQGNWSLPFKFVTDVHRLQQLEAIEKRLNPLLVQRKRLDNQRMNLIHRRDEVMNAAQAIYQEAVDKKWPMKSVFITDGQVSYPTSDFVQSYIGRFTMAIVELERDRRPVKLPHNVVNLDVLRHDVNPLGITATLGFVPGDQLGRVLSWSAGEEAMAAVLVRTVAEQNKILDRYDLPAYAIEAIHEFFVQEGRVRRPRNDHEKAQKRLPLPYPTNCEGFVDYAVNCIALPPDKEDLRDTLFWTIYNRAMVFETREAAQAYMLRCRQRRENVSTLLSMDGYRILSSGMIGPKHRLKKEQNLPYIYGEIEVRYEPKYIQALEQRNLLQRLLPLMKEREDIQEYISRHEQEEQDPRYSAMAKEIQQLQLQRQRLQDSRTLQSPPPSSSSSSSSTQRHHQRSAML